MNFDTWFARTDSKWFEFQRRGMSVALFTCVVFLVLSLEPCVCLTDKVLLPGLAKVNPLRAKLWQRQRLSHIWLHKDLRLNVYALIRTLEDHLF